MKTEPRWIVVIIQWLWKRHQSSLAIRKLCRRMGRIFFEHSCGIGLPARTAVAKSNAQFVVIPVPGEEQEGSAEYGDHEGIEDTKEDRTSRNANPVAPVGQTPGNRVDYP